MSILRKKVNKYINIMLNRTGSKVRRYLFVSLASAVVFVTTYALILPAITVSTTTYCGKEEHNHTGECYETTEVLICGQEDSDGHRHTDACYTTEKTLMCGQEESEGHVHTSDCYDADGNLICGMEEGEGAHHHLDDCYSENKVLICGTEEGEGAHHHTEDCYKEEKVLTCTKEGHTHTMECYADTSADIETSDIWENTMKDVQLTGKWSEDILTIADSQLGYKESSANYIVNEKGEKKGYSRYGAWYGDPYGDWCAMFASFCIRYSDISSKYMPVNGGCQNWIESLNTDSFPYYYAVNDKNSYKLINGEDVVCWNDPEEENEICLKYHPKAGDLIFFNWDNEADADHVGIVYNLEYDKNGQLKNISTIEGNCSNMVKYMTYTADNTEIMGFAELPENPDYTDEKEEKAVGIPIAENPDAEEEKELTISVAVYANSDYSEVIEENGITITGKMPEGITGKAYPVEGVEVEGRRTLCAYDITLFDQDGNVYEPEANESLSVKLSSDLLDAEDIQAREDSEIYYIPEEGNPEKIVTTTEENGVTFEADHFSTYAWTVTDAGTQSSVYLNGASGSDSNDGSSASAAVKTFEKAVSLLAEGGTIYISGTVTISDDQTWSLENSGAKIERYRTFTGALIEIADGGSLILENVEIDGGCGKANSTNVAPNSAVTVNSTYGTTSSGTTVKAPLISVESGGNLVVEDGTVLENNSNNPDLSSNYPNTNNGYVGQGGAVYCLGSMTMNGGTIQYCEAESGGGVYVEGSGSSFNLNGGTITHNLAKDAVNYAYTESESHRYRNAGGGVYLGEGAGMTMIGGTISYNQSAREGGGISLLWLNRTANSYFNSYVTTFTMLGGTICNNTASSTGGGLNITAGGVATISAGTFTGNTAYGNERQCIANSGGAKVYSGGAIYVDAAGWGSSTSVHAGVPGKLIVHRVLITQNTASENGGGIAACATSTVGVNANNTIDLKDGTAIYNNTSNDMYLQGTTNRTNTTLGGGTYTWTNYGSGLKSSISNEAQAVSLAKVIIKNNNAYLGGGIGCNGTLVIGGDSSTTSVSITKNWDDQSYEVDHPDKITVQVMQDGSPYGKPITLVKSTDSDGNETWPSVIVDDLPIGHVYTVSEYSVDGFTSTSNTDSITMTKSWATASSLSNGSTYILKTTSGALANTSGSTLSYMTLTEAEADTAGQWTVTSNGTTYTFTNVKTGNTLGLFSSSSGYSTSYTVKAGSSGASSTAFAYSSSRIYAQVSGSSSGYGGYGGSSYYYLGSSISSGSLSTTTSSNSAATFTLYKQSVSASGTAPSAITITNVTNVRNFTVKKEWDDDNNASGNRPASVKVQLYQESSNVAKTACGTAQVVTASDNWTATWKNLPIKDSSGALYTYTAGEIEVPAGYMVSGAELNSDGVYVITNTPIPTISLPVVKNWVGDTETARPEEITIQLYQEDSNGDKSSYGDPVTITAADNWKYTFTNLPKEDENGTDYIYTLVETSENDAYICTYPENGSSEPELNESGEYVLTNTYQRKLFTVKKNWVDDEPADRPESIQVQLYQECGDVKTSYGDPQTLNSGNNWSYTWIDLPEKDAEENEYTYSVVETVVPDGYYSKESDNGLNSDGEWIITNTKNSSTNVKVTKVWDSSVPETDIQPVSVDLLADGIVVSGKTVTLSTDNSWTARWNELPKYTSTGEEIQYSVQEQEIAGMESGVSSSETYEDKILISQTEVTDSEAEEYDTLVEVDSVNTTDTFVLVPTNGTVLSASSGNVAYSNISVSDGAKITSSITDNMKWTFTERSDGWYTAKNKAGYYLTGTTSYKLFVGNTDYTYASSSSSSPVRFVSSNNNLYLQMNYNSTNYYFTSSPSTLDSSSGSAFTIYKIEHVSKAAVTHTEYEYRTETGTAFTITNKKQVSRLYTLNICKVSAEDPAKVLAGAKFHLLDSDSRALTFVKDSDGYYKPDTGDAASADLVTDDTGYIRIRNLESGTYTFHETEAPSGYQLADDVQVTLNGEAVDCTVSRTIEDSPVSYALPKTGDMGIAAYTIAGLLLMAGAAFLLFLKEKVKRKIS